MDKDEYKYILTLGFDKVLNLLEKEASCLETKRKIINIKPFDNYNTIVKEMEKTDDAYKLIKRFNMPEIDFIYDLREIINKVKLSSQLNMSELIIISKFLDIIYKLVKWKRRNNVETIMKLDYMFNELILLKELKSKIDKIVISEDIIADDASENLLVIRKKLNMCSEKIRNGLNLFIKSPIYQKYLQEPIITIRGGRFVIPVKSEYKSEIKGLVHDTSASGATLFIEPMNIVEINNEITVLEKQEKEEINKILNMLTQQVEINLEYIAKDYNFLIEIDLCFAKAKLGNKMEAVAPKINNKGKINLVKARHPLIKKDMVVPIDINLGYNFDSLIITGPNTGGKTVALKTVGLLTVMAMSGLMIPANEESELSVFDNILVDIGDEQNIEQNLSTFSAHMVNIISILNRANESSLILIDELGAGTDPVEGASLAISILENLKLKGSKILVTTHYPEMKLYALETDKVENASCEFDIETLKPTYKLLIGIPGKSNALLISKKLGLSNNILNTAKLLIGQERNSFEDAIAKIQNKRLEIEHQKLAIDKLEKQLKEDKQKISDIKLEIEKSKVEEINKAKREATQIIDKVRRESQLILDELEKLLKEKENENFYKMAVDIRSKIKSKFKNLENLSDPVKTEENDNSFNILYNDRQFNVGSEVKMLDINQCGVIVSNKDKDGYYFVQMGIMKKKVHESNLAKIDKKKNKARFIVSKNIGKMTHGKIESEIYLIGMPVEEALVKLDKFIDNAVVMGLKTIRIIHGKGTGVLRQAVNNYLNSCKEVESFRLGKYGEGENGVTIVVFR